MTRVSVWTPPEPSWRHVLRWKLRQKEMKLDYEDDCDIMTELAVILPPSHLSVRGHISQL